MDAWASCSDTAIVRQPPHHELTLIRQRIVLPPINIRHFFWLRVVGQDLFDFKNHLERSDMTMINFIGMEGDGTQMSIYATGLCSDSFGKDMSFPMIFPVYFACRRSSRRNHGKPGHRAFITLHDHTYKCICFCGGGGPDVKQSVIPLAYLTLIHFNSCPAVPWLVLVICFSGRAFQHKLTLNQQCTVPTSAITISSNSGSAVMIG